MSGRPWMVPILLFAIGLLAGFAVLRKPQVVERDAPATSFSAERAMEHVRALARAPRPVGSDEHARVRQYIVEEFQRLGMAVEVQQEVSLSELPLPFAPTYHAAAAVENVVVRVPGAVPGQALVLMSHYDSVPASPGANDAGVPVAVLLEAARALRASGRTLRHDVIFLITDGEELGLLGAEAFFAHHRWKNDVAVVLNFDARGSGGPVLMFEAGPRSGWLLRELSSAGRSIVASSLFEEVYRHLDNTTDFTVSKRAGLPGMNFAYIDGVTSYHSPLDRPDAVDHRTVQQLGGLALTLLQTLAERPMVVPNSTELVYFNLSPSTIMRYPAALSVPLAVLAAALWVAAVVRGRKRRSLSAHGFLMGAATTLLTAVLAVAAHLFVVNMIGPRHAEFMRIGDTHNGGWYVAGIAVICASIVVGAVSAFAQRWDPYALACGAGLWWTLLALATAKFLPGASYPFVWPLGFVSAGLLLWPAPGGPKRGARGLAAAAVMLIPPSLILAPLIYLMFLGLTLRFAPGATMLVSFALLLLAPVVAQVTTRGRGRLHTAALGAVGIILVAAASLGAGRASGVLRPSSVVYGLDATSTAAVWATSDDRLSESTRGLLGGDRPERGRLPQFMPTWFRDFFQAPAPPITVAPPSIELRSVDGSTGQRTIVLRLSSPRAARSALLSISGAAVLSYLVDGRAGPNTVYRKQLASTSSPPPMWQLWIEGIRQRAFDVTLVVPEGAALTARLADRSDGLPEFSDASRRPGRDTIGAASLDVEMWGNSTYVSSFLAIPAHPTARTEETTNALLSGPI